MAESTKERILEAALNMFSQYGFAGTNIRELAGSLGMGKSSMYRHFESKEEIWNAAADILFVAACLWKLLPGLAVPLWLWIWIGLIALIKMINLVSGYVMQKGFVALHTVMNKVTGILLFVLPLTLPIVELKYSAPLVCTAAAFAAIQEGHYIRTGKENL